MNMRNFNITLRH